MEKKSIWSTELKENQFKKLNEDLEVDVLIIGGGMTGISTAYHLKDSNLKVCLVERNFIASGVSSRTTGKLTYLQNLIYSKLEDVYSFDVAKKYYESQKYAIGLVREIIKDNNIVCDYIKQKSYLFLSGKFDKDKILKEKELLKKFGAKVMDVKKLPIEIFNYYGISVSDTYYFHPVKYLNALAKVVSNSRINIFERTNIINVKNENEKIICYTENNKITAKKVVFACHYPFFVIPYFFPIKAYLEQSYISASKVLENKNVSGINTSNNSTSFRFYKEKNNNYLIYLFGSHNLKDKFDYKDNFKKMINNSKKLDLNPSYIWSNVDIITNDNLPYIGEIEKNMYIATGYNTWGMTNGSLAGEIISDLIQNKKNKYASLFNPKRKLTLSTFLYNSFCSLKPFIQNKIDKNKSFYSNNVIFKKINGVDVGIYIDKNGNKHVVYNKCPHLKCSLIFNEEELTWECPCHSSKFDLDGKCIKGPSKYNISYKEKE